MDILEGTCFWMTLNSNSKVNNKYVTIFAEKCHNKLTKAVTLLFHFHELFNLIYVGYVLRSVNLGPARYPSLQLQNVAIHGEGDDPMSEGSVWEGSIVNATPPTSEGASSKSTMNQ